MKTTHPLYLNPALRRNIGRALLAGAICWSGLPLYAQNQPPAQPQQVQPGAQAPLTQDDLKELLAPIALYPDALIALILPASTVPSDVVLGSRFVENKGDPAQAGNQPWDDSVKSLVYYPDVLSWMNQNLEWTASVGEAFIDQPADVMNAIQSLRAQARASGALTDTPQQRVVVQEEIIRIIPADPEVIYVPQYDPEVIFVDTYSPGYTPFLTFGFGFAVGSWLNYDCDWGRRYVYRGDWIGWDRGGRGRDRGGDVYINNTNVDVNVVNINSASATRWNPSARSLRQIEQRQRGGGGNARFTTAEARAARDLIRRERRDNNGKLPEGALAAARRDSLPTPGKLQLREAAFNRTAKAQDRESRQNKDANLAEARKDRDNATPNQPQPRITATDRQELRRKTPTEAPRVSGQLDAPRQARKTDELRREATTTRQNVRQQAEKRSVERQSNVPARSTRIEDSDRPSQRPSVTRRQTENLQAPQNFRAERKESQVDRPRQQKVRQQAKPVERKEMRQEARPQQKRQEVRQRAERPQQQKRQEAKPQQRQENRSANRPQQREQRAEKKSSKSDESDKKKKKD